MNLGSPYLPHGSKGGELSGYNVSQINAYACKGGFSMYGSQPGAGAGSVISGAVLLPNTSGNTVLNVIAIAAIVVGVAIVLSSVARAFVKNVLSPRA